MVPSPKSWTWSLSFGPPLGYAEATETMDIKSQFSPACVLLNPPVPDKWALLDCLIDCAAEAWGLDDSLRESSRAALIARERSVSTGMEAGIAVPHAAVEGLPQMIVGMALMPSGLEFESLDQRPAKLVVMILVPKHEKLAHLTTLSQVARRLSDKGFRDRLLAAPDADAIVSMWT